MPEKMRALSLRQPWAEQVMRGEKTVEYRNSATKIRGRIYIYASLGRYSKQQEREFAEEVGYPTDALPRGLLVGTVELFDSIPDVEAGDHCWQLRDACRLAEPLVVIEKPQPVWFYPFGRPN